MADIHDLTAVEQGAAVRRGEVSPLELVDHYLDRIDSTGDPAGAYVVVTADRARTRARRLGDELAAGRGGPSPLFGVPTSVKDLNLQAGVPTRFGTAAIDPVVPPADDAVVARMTAAGLISLGKTNTPEFGLPCYTEPDPEVAKPARTPYDLTRSAGGSSGGAAVSVASGLAPVAQGSDGGGSIRIPASCCGLVGIKPSRGRTSDAPFVDVTGLACAGPLARTVRDAAALLDVVAGSTPGDFSWLPDLAPDAFLAAADREPPRLRVGRYRDPVLSHVTVDPECVAAWERASSLLADLGHDVEDVQRPFGEDAVPAFEIVWAVGASTAPLPPDAEQKLRPLTRWLRERGRAMSAPAFAAALFQVRLQARIAVQATAGYDVVLVPTLASPPVEPSAMRDDDDPAADFEAQKSFTPFTAPYNMTGQPAVTLPLHWTDSGLPVGVMLVGRPGDEATLISLSAQVEAAAPGGDRHPDGW